MSVSLLDLPTELVEHIASYLSLQDLYRLRLAQPRHLPPRTIYRLSQVHQWNAAAFSPKLLSKYQTWDAAPKLRSRSRTGKQVSERVPISIFDKCQSKDPMSPDYTLFCHCSPCTTRREYVEDLTDYTVPYFCNFDGFGTYIHPMRRRSWVSALKELSTHSIFSTWITSVCVCPRPLIHSNIGPPRFRVGGIGLGEAICRLPNLTTLWMYEMDEVGFDLKLYEISSVISEIISSTLPSAALKNLVLSRAYIPHKILVALLEKYASTLQSICLHELEFDDHFFSRTVLRALLSCKLTYLKLHGLCGREPPLPHPRIKRDWQYGGIMLRNTPGKNPPFRVRYFFNEPGRGGGAILQSITISGREAWQNAGPWLKEMKECRNFYHLPGHDLGLLARRYPVTFKDESESFEFVDQVRHKWVLNRGWTDIEPWMCKQFFYPT